MKNIDTSKVLIEVGNWLKQEKYKFALVGGLAVSFRTIERNTKDVDFVLMVSSDHDAEKVVRGFQGLGYSPTAVLESKSKKRLATVRLVKVSSSDKSNEAVIVDLLFCTCGIEKEVASSADQLEILPKLKIGVATIPSLLAMKVLSADINRRPVDINDIKILIKRSTNSQLSEAKKLVKLIEKRGFNRGKQVYKDFERYLKLFRYEQEDPYFIEVKDFGDRFKLREVVKAKSKNKTKLTKPKLAKPKSKRSK